MLKKLFVTAACALTVGSVFAAPPPKPGETAANPFMMTIGSHVDIKWDPPGPGMWVWAELEKMGQLHVAVASTTTFDFGLAPPNSGNVQNFEFKLYINGLEQLDVGAPGMVSYYDNITLNSGTDYLFTLMAYNVHDNAANTDIDLLARGANDLPPNPQDPQDPPLPPLELPEPASLGLLGLGLLGLGLARRRTQ